MNQPEQQYEQFYQPPRSYEDDLHIPGPVEPEQHEEPHRDFSSGGMPLHSMQMESGVTTYLFIPGLQSHTVWGYLLLCFICFSAGVFSVVLKCLGQKAETRILSKEGSSSSKWFTGVFFIAIVNFCRAVAVFIISSWDYFLMLGAMSMNVGIFIATISGVSTGYLFLGHLLNPSSRNISSSADQSLKPRSSTDSSSSSSGSSTVLGASPFSPSFDWGGGEGPDQPREQSEKDRRKTVDQRINEYLDSQSMRRTGVTDESANSPAAAATAATGSEIVVVSSPSVGSNYLYGGKSAFNVTDDNQNQTITYYNESAVAADYEADYEAAANDVDVDVDVDDDDDDDHAAAAAAAADDDDDDNCWPDPADNNLIRSASLGAPAAEADKDQSADVSLNSFLELPLGILIESTIS